MGRPVGSLNRQKPFTDALRVALLSGGGRRLRVIAEKLAEKAEQGDLQAIQQIGDRLDGKPAQAFERADAPLEAMTDRQLMAIIRGGSPEPLDEPSYPGICRRVSRCILRSNRYTQHLGTNLGIEPFVLPNTCAISMS